MPLYHGDGTTLQEVENLFIGDGMELDEAVDLFFPEQGDTNPFASDGDSDALAGGVTGTIEVTFNADNTEATLTAVPSGSSTYTYEWNLLGDRATITETAITYTVTADGTYELRITDTISGQVSDYICAIVDINEGPSAVLVVNDASVLTSESLSGSVTVADANHPTTVTWVLTYNGSTVTSGTGDVTNQAFSGVSPGAAGTRSMVLTATDDDGATATDSINVTVTAPRVDPRGNVTISSITINGVTAWNGSTVTSISLASLTSPYAMVMSGTYQTTRAASGGASATIRANGNTIGGPFAGATSTNIVASTTGSGNFTATRSVGTLATGSQNFTFGNGTGGAARFNYDDTSVNPGTVITVTA